MQDERQDEPSSGAPEAAGDATAQERPPARDPERLRRLGRGGAALAGVARDSAAEVVRGSAAATREGAALAERASRIVYWPALLCVLGAMLLQIPLPGKLTVGPQFLLPSLEGALLIGLAVATARTRDLEPHPARRWLAIGLIALVTAANAVSLYLLAHELLHKHISNGRSLILSGVTIWITNVLIFALWFWLLDRGGPANRLRHPDPTTPEGHPDFVFPEMDGGKPYTPATWMPQFVDYLTLAITTSTAFSPTDAMPNSRTAKALMSIEGLISLVTIGLIISRAVNILA
jgi:hypothetical protein